MNDRKWLREYASLDLVDRNISKKKKEASFRLKKLGTNYYLCTSISQSNEQNLTLLAFYELHEDRFGREQRVDKKIIDVLNTQVELIKKQLELSETEVELGLLKKAMRYTLEISKIPLERIIPYKYQAGIIVINVISIIILTYLTSLQKINNELAIAVYTLILMISLESVRLKQRK